MCLLLCLTEYILIFIVIFQYIKELIPGLKIRVSVVHGLASLRD
jgi:hypothetical protein